MKKFFVILLTICVVSLAFAKGPTTQEVQGSVNRVEASEEAHTRNIADMEAQLKATDSSIEYHDLLQRLANKGAAMSWQRHLFDQAKDNSSREPFLAEYKKLDAEYKELIQKLSEFKSKL
jgi:hypothetical protein